MRDTCWTVAHERGSSVAGARKPWEMVVSVAQLCGGTESADDLRHTSGLRKCDIYLKSDAL